MRSGDTAIRYRVPSRVVPAIGDEQREQEILAALRGRARMLVREEEFLKPLTHEAGWSLGQNS